MIMWLQSSGIRVFETVRLVRGRGRGRRKRGALRPI